MLGPDLCPCRSSVSLHGKQSLNCLTKRLPDKGFTPGAGLCPGIHGICSYGSFSGPFKQRNVMCFVPVLNGEGTGSVLVSVHQAQVPLLEGDAVDHHEIVQVVLSCGCSSWDRPSLGGYSATWRVAENKTRDRQDRG